MPTPSPCRFANPGVTGFDRRIDEIAALLIWQESALHRVNGDLLEIIQSQPKGLRGRCEFLRHACAAHQPVVRVQRDAEFLLVKNPEGMFRQTRRGARVHVTQQANLQRDALVENVLSQIAQLHRLAFHDGDIVNQPRPVPDAVRSAILNRLPDRFLSIAFTGMNRDIEVLALDVMKSIHMLLRGITAFFARYFDTMASGAGDYSNSHGYGAIVSGSVTWYTQNRWLGLIQVNWIKARSSVDTVSGLVGIGYQLDAPPSKESPVMTQSSQTGPFKNEISGLIGMTIQNSYDSEEATAYSVEYRRRLWRYLDWTVAWIYEGDDQLSRRNGLATQLWAVRSFFDDRLTLGIGAGPYLQIDEWNGGPGEGDNSHLVSVLISATAVYRFTSHWGTRITWNRLATHYDRDTDIFLIGPSYSF